MLVCSAVDPALIVDRRLNVGCFRDKQMNAINV